ncbi:MAG TPA: LPS biosynthesis protein WbpP [Elusimicrobia bacterium]|nr:LPS biosynthesis protein WbpP [Elusimicrobiota bacterium]
MVRKKDLVLVTGGAGFIGSNIIDKLLEKDYKVRIIDNFCTGKIENIRHIINEVELIRGDIRNKNIVDKAMKGVDCVFHEAALRSVPRSIDDPVSTNDVNINGTLNLLMAAKKSGVKRFIYASSSSLYGDAKDLPKKESQRPQPVSPYAVSKLTGEYYCRVFSKSFGLETVSLRYFNVFGPRQDSESKYAVVVPKFINSGLKKEPFLIHGDGKQSRDFTYIDNVVSANILAMKAKDVSGMAFNIACHERYSVLDIAYTVSKILKIKPKFIFEPRRAGDVMHTFADIEFAKKYLKFKPLVLFKEGMSKTIEYFRHKE